jgi:1,4-alpha-glucan branching enzyme
MRKALHPCLLRRALPVSFLISVSAASFILTLSIATFLVPASARAAGHDGVVDWTGVSHVPWQDRRPICPIDGEAFQVRLQTLRGDITSARVHVDDGTAVWVDAHLDHSRGPYHIWSALIPGTASTTVHYFFELTDGGDTDYLSVSGMSDSLPEDDGFVVDFATLEHAPVGATLTTTGAVFKVWSPTQTTAYVRGEFNGWGTGNPMTRVGEFFIAHVPEAGDRQQYKYMFDGSIWNTDPRARALDPPDNYNAYLEDPFRYAWTTPDFKTPPLDRMVVYQLHVGTFAGRNDPLGSTPFPSRYVDVAARAGSLAELGVNAVMLNPITEFPGDYSAGYNPIIQSAPEWKYGTPDDLKAMINAFHAHGIAVLLDIVWNHVSITDNILWNYDGTQIYFDSPPVDTPWGAQADLDRDQVRDFYADSALQWLEEFHLDGFRMDATGYLNIPPQDASGWSLMQRFNDEIDQRWVDKVAIAEQLPDNDWVTRPTSMGGAGFDAQYHDAYTDGLRGEILEAAFGDPSMGTIRNIINGNGQYLSGARVLNYFELHDEAWPESGGQRMVVTIDPSAPHDDMWAKGRVKLAQGLTMFAPGIPAILMGTEWLEDTPFGTQSENRIDWSKKATYAPIFQYFQDIIALRTGNISLAASSPVLVFHLDEAGNVIAFRRSLTNADVFVVVANFSNDDHVGYRLGLPEDGLWEEVVNSQATRYDGNGMENPGDIVAEAVPADGFPQSGVIDLPQMGLLLLRWTSNPVAVGPSDGIATTSIRLEPVYPNPTSARSTIAFHLTRREHVRLSVYDVRGRTVEVLVDDSLPAGRHTAFWNTRRVPSGVYFLRLVAGEHEETRKAVVTR